MGGTRDAILFDLDGTLADTAGDLHLVLAETLAAEGLPAPPLAAVRGMIGEGARVLVERALAALGERPDPERVERLFERFRARYAEEPCRASSLYLGARELLATLADRGFRLGLCTNKPQAATEGLLAALGIEGRFGAVLGGDAVRARKPHPDHLADTLSVLGSEPARAIMVGDSRNDLVPARALKMPCILVSFGYTATPARELGADAVIDRLADLPAALTALGPLPS